ncbi:MAG: hypothetical protein GY874_10430 [Desulfobacteraceae bacterium]|nr:hypothetical protein [Desulfobacteraceae bacterium]
MFDILAEQTKDLHIARKALFGLACSKFMIADSPESYADAIKLWEKWTKFAPRSWENENPILVAPLVREKMLFSNIPPLPITGNDSFKIKKMTSKQLLIRTTQELDIHKRKLKDSEAKSRGQTVKINNLKNEIVKLKRQIKALETIDQKIQKKKNAIPQRIDD